MPEYNGVKDYSTHHQGQNEEFVQGGSKRPDIIKTTEGATDTTKSSSLDPLKFANLNQERPVQNSQ